MLEISHLEFHRARKCVRNSDGIPPSVRSIGASVIWKCFSILQREGELEEGTKVRGDTVKFELQLESGGDSAGASTRSSFLSANLNLIP